MASFFENLWESIFTPGPTPTLLIATNVTFAALQIVLACLLFATWSIHFVVLSVLCGGLWVSINWFAAELTVHQIQEEEKARRAKEAGPAPATSEDSETEVEAATSTASLTRQESIAEAVSHEVEPIQQVGELKHRVVEETPSFGKARVTTLVKLPWHLVDIFVVLSSFRLNRRGWVFSRRLSALFIQRL